MSITSGQADEKHVHQAKRILFGPLINLYCMYKKSWPISWRNLLYIIGQVLLDIPYRKKMSIVLNANDKRVKEYPGLAFQQISKKSCPFWYSEYNAKKNVNTF